MSLFGRARLFPGLSGGMPRIPVTVSTRYFFDRAEVLGALHRLEHRGLSRSSLLVRTTAIRSIRRVGAARPRLRIQTQNPNVLLSVLLQRPGLRPHTARALRQRLAEIQNPQNYASAPGTPPHTHVPHAHMLGFRRNLYNAMDPSMTSAVVGPARRGRNWTIPHLHEFGGVRTLREVVYRPSAQWRTVITRWQSGDQAVAGNWAATGRTRQANYPARPFMLPALQRCLPRIRAQFGNQFNGRRN